MRKIAALSIACATLLFADNSTDMGTISITEQVNSFEVENVSHEQIKSADLAEALMKNVPSVSIVRRSGIANDIILRGQKKDNINILIDDAKIYGACPNRMDPPTSHVLTNNIESVDVIEGPYDVENFGTLSGLVKVKTKEPEKGFHGEVNLSKGSFGYEKASATLNGGTDKFKFLISASTEQSDQYEDGDGNDFYDQQINKGINSVTSKNMMGMTTTTDKSYADPSQEAYEKKTVLTKFIYNIDDDSEIKLSYTANRSDNVLYPNTPMDADSDDSDIYTIGYTKRDLGEYSKELNIDYYYSKVDHPMSTKLRNNGETVYMTNYMKSSIWGGKIKNNFELSDYLITFGLDASVRNWRGEKYNSTKTMDTTSLTSTDTTNKAIFSKVEKSFGKLDLEFGTRYDYTDIDPTSSSKTDRTFAALSGNIFGIYNLNKDTKIFAGIGKSSRVPDARELYYSDTNNDLEDTKNYEADLGFEKFIGDLSVKTKVFYSKLEDYIYYTGSFENIDAKIYGLEISGIYQASENLSFDYGLAYQRGKKDGNYEDKDLAEIPPLKANLALNYKQDSSKYTAEVIAVDRWNEYDDSASEQELAGYMLVNLKYNNQLNKNFDITLGVDNLFDTTYASTNTYEDVTYVTTGGSQILLNDPGRFGYINIRYSF